MEKPGGSPERIDQILKRMLVGGRRIVPNTPTGPCVLCGDETTHADSIGINDERKHFTCRTSVRDGELKVVMLTQDYLRVADALGLEPILYRRLESRLLPHLDHPTAENLCRMITFCLAEIRKDPSLSSARKKYLVEWLGKIRSSYLPNLN